MLAATEMGGVAPTLTGDHENRVTDYTAVTVYPINTMVATRGKKLGRGTGFGIGEPGDPQYTISTAHEHAVCYPATCDKIYQNTGVGWWNEATVAETLRTPCGGDATKANLVIEKKPPRKYIVRRLMPIECSRLQGYPDGWTENLGTEETTEEEIEFFTEVWARWAMINGTKPKSRAQVIKWLKDPGSDSAEYKAYGNSLAIPCSSDVLGRIAAFVEEEEHE